MCERRAVAAERGAMDRYVAAFMAEHVGATFAGRITSVTRFGLFATLDGTGADGLIPIRSLGQEFFRHDEGRQLPDRRAHRRDLRPGRPREGEAGRGRHRHRRPAVRHRRGDRAGRAPGPAARRRPAPCRTPRAAAASGRASRPPSGQTVTPTKVSASAHLAGMNDDEDHRPGRFLDRPAARLARTLPALRQGRPVRSLPEDAEPLPGVRSGARAISRRRRAGLFHDLRRRSHCRAPGPDRGALRPAAAALVSRPAVAAAVGLAGAVPASPHQGGGHCAALGAPDRRPQTLDRRSSTSP